MQEQPRPLEIVLMSYTVELARRNLRALAEDNAEQVDRLESARGRLLLKDGTRIKAISPGMVRRGFDGYRFDQLILADDHREALRLEAAHEIEVIRWECMASSCVPEEYQVLCYNIDAPEPCRECGRPGEVLRLQRTAAEGVTYICRECHTRAHMEALADAFGTVGKAFAEAGISADVAAAAFQRAAEVAHNILTPETEIALIKANPSLSRFQKWRLVRQIKRRTP